MSAAALLAAILAHDAELRLARQLRGETIHRDDCGNDTHGHDRDCNCRADEALNPRVYGNGSNGPGSAWLRAMADIEHDPE